MTTAPTLSARRSIHSRPGRARRGFVLVEGLVVISIIGIIVGLLLPSVNSARTAAEQLDSDRLAPLRADLIAAADETDRLAMGSLDTLREALSAGSFSGDDAQALLLPYIEQEEAWAALLRRIEAAIGDGSVGEKQALITCRKAGGDTLRALGLVRARLQVLLPHGQE